MSIDRDPGQESIEPSTPIHSHLETILADTNGKLSDSLRCGNAFLSAIIENPDDDGPRLMYADWLTEHGDSRGEFIRVQCELATMPPEEKERREKLLELESALLKAHGQQWTSSLRELGMWEMRLQRGFVCEGNISSADLLAHEKTLAAIAPLQALYIRINSWPMNGIVNCPLLRNLTNLNLYENVIGPDGAKLLAGSPHLSRLTTLDVSRTHIGDAGIGALADSPHLSRLTRLILHYNQISDAGVAALANSKNLCNLTTLNLLRNPIGPKGVQNLANSKNFCNLTTLNLWENAIGSEGAQALADSPHISRLTTLDLSNNQINDTGVAALANSKNLCNLTTLNLHGNRIGDAGVAALANSPHLARVMTLDLGFNAIRSAGAEALVNSPYLSSLMTLNLGGNPMREEDTTALKNALRDSRRLPSLQCIHIPGCSVFSPAPVQAILDARRKSKESSSQV